MALDDILGKAGETDGFLNEIATGSSTQAPLDILLDTKLREAAMIVEVAEQRAIIIDSRRRVR
jgi:hypothetical protein